MLPEYSKCYLLLPAMLPLKVLIINIVTLLPIILVYNVTRLVCKNKIKYFCILFNLQERVFG